MRTRVLTMLGFAILLATIGVAATQPSPDDQRRATITLMRAINTAENAVKQKTGKYAHLTELLEHAAMGRLKAEIVVDTAMATYHGSTIRLALSTDASQYQVAIVPSEKCGLAAFSDERGLIYTGTVLDC